MQTNDGTVTYGVFTPAGATFRKLIFQNDIVIPDDAISLSKVTGLTAALGYKASIESRTNLSTLVDGKQEAIDASLSFSSRLFRISTGPNFSIQRLIDDAYILILNLQYNNGVSRLIVDDLRLATLNGFSNLDILDTLAATQVIASNLYTKIETDELLANLNSNNNDLDSKQDLITPTTALACGTLIITAPVNVTKCFTTGTHHQVN